MRVCGLWTRVLIATAAAGCAPAHRIGSPVLPSATHVVIVPVADVRAKPQSFPSPGTHDPSQETQVLYGEGVRLIATRGDWAMVEAVEQPEYTHQQRWQGYPGWVPLAALRPRSRAEGQRPTNAVVVDNWAAVARREPAQGPELRLPVGTHVRAGRAGRSGWNVQLLDGTTGRIASGQLRLLRDLHRLSS